MTNRKISDILTRLQKTSINNVPIKYEAEKHVKRISTIGFLKFHGFGISEILPNLYLSGQDIATSFDQLDKHKITHILNLTSNVENLFESRINYKRIKMNDTLDQNILDYLEESFEFIDEGLNHCNGKVLVHCNAGVSRSASIIIAYLLYKNHFKSFNEAFNHVKKCRSVIHPNPNFIFQLKDYENKLNSIKIEQHLK